MKVVVNFYILSDENEDNYQELITGIKTENPMYLTLQSGDTIVSPKEENVEYIVNEIVKDFYKEELNIYISKVKSNGEILDEIGQIANKTIQSMLDSFKDVFTELDKTLSPEPTKDKDEKVDDKNILYINKITDNKKGNKN